MNVISSDGTVDTRTAGFGYARLTPAEMQPGDRVNHCSKGGCSVAHIFNGKSGKVFIGLDCGHVLKVYSITRLTVSAC